MKARIIHDGYGQFDVQFKRWWLPFWITDNYFSFRTLEKAEQYAKRGQVVEFL